MKKHFYATLCLAICLLFSIGNKISASNTETSTGNFEQMLNQWAQSFIDKIPDDYIDTLNIHLKDTDSHWYIVFQNKEYNLHQGKNPNAKMVITADLETYHKLYTGELNGMTAVGRASIHDSAPLDMWLENGMTIRKMNWNQVYFTISNFFNLHPHNKVFIGRDYSRNVHGGNVVALYYSVGYRSAYYNLEKGQTLNESGEKDPFNQSFIIISGNGYAKIGNDTLTINANEAYYIKPNIEHKVWTENDEGISLIWNAWGSEAW